jgi:hypothetical protein
MRGGNTKQQGSIGELRVMYEAAKRGYGVLIPHGDFAKYDLVVERRGSFERVQVKSVTPAKGVLVVPTKTMIFAKGTANNRSQQVMYSAGDFEWLAVYDLANHNVYFIPAAEVINRTAYSLRLEPTKNLQVKGVKMATEFVDW